MTDRPTLLDLTLARFGSIAKLAAELDVARPPLSAALHGHRTCSIMYWRAIASALGIDWDDLDDYLLGDQRRTGGGGTLAGSIRCRTR